MSQAENVPGEPPRLGFPIGRLGDPDGWFEEGWADIPWCSSWKAIYDCQECLLGDRDDPILLEDSVAEVYLASEKSIFDLETRMLGDPVFIRRFCTRKMILRLARRHATVQSEATSTSNGATPGWAAPDPNWTGRAVLEKCRRELFWSIMTRMGSGDTGEGGAGSNDDPADRAPKIGPAATPRPWSPIWSTIGRESHGESRSVTPPDSGDRLRGPLAARKGIGSGRLRNQPTHVWPLFLLTVTAALQIASLVMLANPQIMADLLQPLPIFDRWGERKADLQRSGTPAPIVIGPDGPIMSYSPPISPPIIEAPSSRTPSPQQSFLPGDGTTPAPGVRLYQSPIQQLGQQDGASGSR